MTVSQYHGHRIIVSSKQKSDKNDKPIGRPKKVIKHVWGIKYSPMSQYSDIDTTKCLYISIDNKSLTLNHIEYTKKENISSRWAFS